MHETSRFRSTVDAALERQLADEARRARCSSWSVFALWLLLLAWGLGCMGLFVVRADFPAAGFST